MGRRCIRTVDTNKTPIPCRSTDAFSRACPLTCHLGYPPSPHALCMSFTPIPETAETALRQAMGGKSQCSCRPHYPPHHTCRLHVISIHGGRCSCGASKPVHELHPAITSGTSSVLSPPSSKGRARQWPDHFDWASDMT
jgi:hypothetical protein